jgi:hypothetical protein
MSRYDQLRRARNMAKELYQRYEAEVRREPQRTHERDPISGTLIDRNGRLVQLRSAWERAEWACSRFSADE